MSRPTAKPVDRLEIPEVKIQPIETSWDIANFFAKAGNVVCRKHPSNITYERAKKFLTDPTFLETTRDDKPFIVGKFLWDSWTFDFDLNISTMDVEGNSLQHRMETLYDLAYNKHNLKLDLSYIYDIDRSTLPQKNELIEANLGSELDEENWIWEQNKEIYRLYPNIVSYEGEPIDIEVTEKWKNDFSSALQDKLESSNYYKKINDHVSLVYMKYSNKKFIKNILDSSKEHLMHQMSVTEFLSMSEEQFNKIKNY